MGFMEGKKLENRDQKLGFIKRHNLLMVILVFSFLFLISQSAFAQAELFITPSTGTYKVGELFSVLVKVNTAGKAINAASAQLNFDNQRLDVTSVGYSQSIFSIWTEEPNSSNAAGTIKFSGGVPNPGFVGASGAIARVTFRPKASGSAPVVFVSGGVLANDGRGTNIGDTLKGGLYSIIAASQMTPKSQAPAKEAAPAVPITGQPPDVPILTDWPRQIEEGSVLTVRGIGFPNGRILLFFQKGEGEPKTQETFAGPDGRFTSASRESVSSGFYRIWVRNISFSGVPSASSETVTVEVVKPLFFRIGTYAINFASVIVTLLALLILAVGLLVWSWMRFRKWRESQGKEISEAEKTLHRGFDTLHEGLRAYIDYLTHAKSSSEMRHREESTRHDVKEELEEVEEKIEKEIEDIKKKR